MTSAFKCPEITFTTDIVKGTTKKANIVLSENYQIPDSLIGVLINSPEFAEFFKMHKTNDDLKTVKDSSKDHNNLFNIFLNNAVQDAQLSDDAKRIYLKDMTHQIELMSSIYEFENNAEFFKLCLKFVSHGLHLMRVTAGIEEAQEDSSPEEDLAITEEEEKNFEVFSSVIEAYQEAQNLLREVEPSQLVDYMSKTFGRYDSFYTVLEFIRFILRCIYEFTGDFTVDLNMALNIYLGLPIFNLQPKLRSEILAWALNRNWPDETDLSEDENDEKKQVGVKLSKWASKMIEIIKALHETEFDSKRVEEKTKFYNQIFDTNTQNLEWLYAPLLAPDEPTKGYSCDMTFLQVSKEVYLTTQSCEIRVVSGNRLVEFSDVQLSDMEESKKSTSFKEMRQKLCELKNIPGSEYIVATPRSRKMCSYDFEDEITDAQFIGDRLFFYHFDGAKDKLLNDGFKPLFIQLSDNLVLPLILDGGEPLKTAIPDILAGLTAHQYDFTEETLRKALRFGLSEINWDECLDVLYGAESANNGKGEMMEGAPMTELLEDQNSKIGIMFKIEIDSDYPAYKKEDVEESQRFKLSLGNLLKGIYTKSEENADFDLKNISSKIFAVDISHHSMKIDFIQGFTLKGSDFSDKDEVKDIENNYELYALLSKSYGGFELFFKEKGENKFYSSNSGNTCPDDIVAAKKASIVFYKRVD